MVVRLPRKLLECAHAASARRGMDLPTLVRNLLALACDAKTNERIGTYVEIEENVMIVSRHPLL
jgi:hypothetical protein